MNIQGMRFYSTITKNKNFFLSMVVFLVASISFVSCTSMPKYKAKGPQAVSIDIESTSVRGLLEVRKLSNDCRLEAKLEKIKGNYPKKLFVDATDKFTFQFILYAPQNVGCKIQNTIAMKRGDSYRILVTPPLASSSKDQLCAISLQVRPSDSGALNGMLGEWKSGQFEGTCAINQRF